MLVYEGIKTTFLDDVDNDSIASKIEEKVYQKLKRRTPKSEFKSWMQSLLYMYKILNDQNIPNDVGIAIEYNIPNSSKRVDFMISGYDEESKPNVVIIELKQWDYVDELENSDGIVKTYLGRGLREHVHPSYQAWSYKKLIEDYNSEVQDGEIKLTPCAYLHNYHKKDNDPLFDNCYKKYLEAAPAYTNGDTQKLRDFIKKFVKKGDNRQILYCIDNGKIRPSKSLQDSISSMLNNNDVFTMIDEQKVVFEKIVQLSEECQRDRKKRTLICEGGPGTGKSVVAIQSLAELTRKGQLVQYTSKNGAPRQVYLALLKKGQSMSGVDNMFRSASDYIDVQSNNIDTILVDEAHRLSSKSFYKGHMAGENQIKEIINASLCNIFFIDEEQKVTTSDIGTKEEIKKWAKKFDSEVYEYELVSQFRCNGSNGYLAWLDDVLQIRETANYDLEGIDFDFKVFDDPFSLREEIIKKNESKNKARLVAGYCWEWPKENRNNPNKPDIKIGDFEMSWNLQGGKAFAIKEDSINQVGCIHTTQGLEFDYVGVIIGDDLRYENKKVITDFTKRANSDQSVKGLKGKYKEDKELALKIADEIIKNTYRTLMTRGMKGCYVYCTNKELSDYLKQKINITNS